jgi:hypothetical protein
MEYNINMEDIWKKAKENQEVLHFENFQTPTITWEEIVTFIYNESILNSGFEDKVRSGLSYGNTTHGLATGNLFAESTYLLPQSQALHKFLNGVSELMEKVNGSKNGDNCQYYDGPIGQYDCTCKLRWHIQGLRFSIGDKYIGNHNDPCDVLYWQILGTSYWTINDDKVYKLNPGDLLYFNKEDTHRVTQDGPRVAIIIDGRK